MSKLNLQKIKKKLIKKFKGRRILTEHEPHPCVPGYQLVNKHMLAEYLHDHGIIVDIIDHYSRAKGIRGFIVVFNTPKGMRILTIRDHELFINNQGVKT